MDPYECFSGQPTNLIVEYAPSGRAACMFCNKVIAYQETRFGVVGYYRQYERRKYSHLECLKRVHVRIHEKLNDNLPGMNTLKADDQAKVRKIIAQLKKAQPIQKNEKLNAQDKQDEDDEESEWSSSSSSSDNNKNNNKNPQKPKPEKKDDTEKQAIQTRLQQKNQPKLQKKEVKMLDKKLNLQFLHQQQQQQQQQHEQGILGGLLKPGNPLWPLQYNQFQHDLLRAPLMFPMAPALNAPDAQGQKNPMVQAYCYTRPIFEHVLALAMRRSNADLRRLLEDNKEPTTGTHEELARRFADRSLGGSVPRCEVCGAGVLTFDCVTREYTCQGFDEEDEARGEKVHVDCDMVYQFEEIRRRPWKSDLPLDMI